LKERERERERGREREREREYGSEWFVELSSKLVKSVRPFVKGSPFDSLGLILGELEQCEQSLGQKQSST
jgi:hypothetical protein